MEESQFQKQNSIQQSKNKKTMLMIIGVAILVIGLVGLTYAFFNYTRTGSSNTIKVGKISFNGEQGQSINLTNMFPIDVSNGIPNDNTKVGIVTINITGDTTYSKGIEYLVSAVNVQNTVGTKELPISIDVSVANNTDNDPVTNLGTASENYYSDRGHSTSYYKVLATDVIENNEQLLVGYITPGSTGVDGNIVIKAYIDKEKVAISNTYPEGDVTHTEGEEPNQTTVTDYTNGTTTEWVNERTVFTTEEWNSLKQNGVSFQVKVEANEGTWIEAPLQETPVGCFKYYSGETTLNGQSILYPLGVENMSIRGFYGPLNPGETSTEWDYDLSQDIELDYVYDARCKSTDIVVPSSIDNKPVTIIDVGAFWGGLAYDNSINDNFKITSVVIPNTVEIVGIAAFSENALTSVILPDSVKIVDEKAFADNNITSITFSNNIKKIEIEAFDRNNLSSVTIPSSIEEVGYRAFFGNSNLASITFEGKTCSEILFLNDAWSTWGEYAATINNDHAWSDIAKIIDGSGNICYDPNA